MHGYYWDRQRLKDKLVTFSGGQFLIESKNGLVYRGEIKDWSIPNIKKRLVLVYFAWLCEEHSGKWVSVEPLRIDVEFRFYYFQRQREDRKERIKMWTSFGEICRFFKKDDPSNLRQNGQGDEFLPCYQASKLDSGGED